MDYANWLICKFNYKGTQRPATDENVDKANNDTSNKIANVVTELTECNNKEVFLDERKLHFDIHFGGIEISHSALIVFYRMFLGLIWSLIQGTDISTSPGLIWRFFSYLSYYLSDLMPKETPKPENHLLKNVELNNSLNKSYIIVNEENEKHSLSPNYIIYLSEQNIYSGNQGNLKDERDVNQISLNDYTRHDLSNDTESHKHETSHQTEMSVHIKSEASPKNLKKIQSFPEESLAVDKQHEHYQNEPEILEKLKKLAEIKSDAKIWAEEIMKFDGDHKTFLHIQEMLLRDIDAADLVYANGKDIIKQEKRDIITFVQKELDKLEIKNKNVSTKM